MAHFAREQALQEQLEIHFDRVDLLAQALTHRSFLAEEGMAVSNERLEFLGDAVLDLIIADELYHRYTTWPEGALTKAKAAVVDGQSLAEVARRWGLGAFMRVSHGEDTSGGRERRALLADAVEAVIGAYYLDQGLESCRAFVLREMAPVLATVERMEHERDYKTLLQEALQRRYQAAPTYEVLSESGPPHDRTFTVAVTFGGELLGRGEGKSKKAAEQCAAAEALHSALVQQE